MPPLKSPAAFHEQRKSLERAKTEDYLKHKIKNRPEKSDLVSMHILQDSSAEGAVQATQLKLKRARLADNLNEKIALRPGPLELVEKNIIPVDSTVKEAIKGNNVNFPKPTDAFAFEEDSSNDGLSPEQPRSEESQGSVGSPPETKSSDTTSSAPSTTQSPGSVDVKEQLSPPNNQAISTGGSKQTNSRPSPPIPVPAAVKSKSSSENKNRHKKPKDSKPKVKKLKYHQYIPPDQKAEKSPPPMDTAYARLLQQQQLFLQLQILSQQQHQQHQHQHFSYQTIQSQLKQPAEQLVRNPSSSPVAVSGSSHSPVKTSFHGQAGLPCIKPGPLPSNLDDLKVSELRQQLRLRGLPVSGTKTALMERLKPFQDPNGSSGPNSSEITTVTFPVTPNSSISSYQSQTGTSVLSNGFYQFGSTSSSPPISPASSDLSVSGSLPDTFSDGPICSPQFSLQPSPVPLGAEDSLMNSMSGGSLQAELEGMDAQKDKMLVEKQKVINELTWKLQQEQRQVEELRMQLQKRKRNNEQEMQGPPHNFFGVTIKQENVVSSCPFASKQMATKAQNHNSCENLSGCAAPQLSNIMTNHCMETLGTNTVLSSSFLSPQCSPQHSPLGPANSPQHISLPPSPNSHYLLSVSPGSQGAEGRSVSPQSSNRHRTVQTSCSYSPSQTNMQPLFISSVPENSHSTRDSSTPRSPNLPPKIPALNSSGPANQQFRIPSPTFCGSNSSLSTVKQPPSYEDAVKQQMTRSQQMDELLDVLIESGEMPANAKDNRSSVQKRVPQITVSSGNSSVPAAKSSGSPYAHISSSQHPFEHCTSNGDGHLEALLSNHSPLGRTSEMTMLKMSSDSPRLERMTDGFSGKTRDEFLGSRDILEKPLSPMDTQISPTSTDGSALNLNFTESPWESMEWLDLTPPSSATGFGPLNTTGPNIFNTDFLDVTDLNLNTAMDLHLEHW
ncbi:myocardin [Latimeria chalumnae]|uniref:myocardin n=1 Tax=Latimeria chalumnae TaxID=7897 RepID=UPI00313D9C25